MATGEGDALSQLLNESTDAPVQPDTTPQEGNQRLQRISDLVQGVVAGQINREDARSQLNGRDVMLFEKTLRNLSDRQRGLLSTQDVDAETVRAGQDVGEVPTPEQQVEQERVRQQARQGPQAARPEEPEEQDTLSSLLNQPVEEGVGPPTEFTTARAFREGFEAGVTDIIPFVEAGEETPDHPIAGALGELIGMGVSFVGPLKVGQAAAKGVGMLRGLSSAAASQFAAETITGQAITGAVSGGLFEAALAESPQGALIRGTLGAGVGAIADPLAMKTLNGLFAGRAVAGRRAAQAADEGPPVEVAGIRPVESGGEAGLESLTGARLKVKPRVLSTERHLSPLKLASEGEDQLQYAVKKMMTAEPDEGNSQILGAFGFTFRPGGTAIVQATEGPQNVLPQLRRMLPDRTEFATRKADDGTFEMLINDPVQTRDRLVAKIATTEATEKVVKKAQIRFMEDGSPAFTFDEGLKLVREEFGGEPPVEVEFRSDWGPRKRGRWRPRPHLPKNLISIQDQRPEIEQFSTLVHEMLHEWTRTQMGSGLSKTQIDEVWDYAGFPVDELDQVKSEMDEAVVHLLKKKENQIVDEAVSLDDARSIANSNAGYYRSDQERMAWTAQLMFTDPRTARRVAPRASRRLAQAIHDDSPKLRRLLNVEHENIERVITQEFVSPERRVFAEVPFRLDDAKRAQFKSDGLAEGLEVRHKGEPWEYQQKLERTRLKRGSRSNVDQLHKIRHPYTGETKLVTREEFVRETLPELRQRTDEIRSAVDDVLDSGPGSFVDVALRDPESGNVVRGAINLENFARTDNLTRWIRQNRPQATSPLTGRRPRSTIVNDAEARRVAQQLNIDGVLVNDNGRYRAIVANTDAIQEGEVAIRESALVTSRGQTPRRVEPSEQAPEAVRDAVESGVRKTEGFARTQTGEVVDGTLGDNVIDLSFENVTRGMLREAGVEERELPYFMDVVKERYNVRLRDLIDDEFSDAVDSADELAREATDDLEDAARRVNLEANRTDGEIRLVHADNKSEVASGLSEEEAWEYISRVGSEEDQIPKAAGIPDESVGPSAGGTAPPKFQQQAANFTAEDIEDANWFKRFVAGEEILGATFSAMENFAKSAENALDGVQPFTEVFDKGQRAIEAVNHMMAGVERPRLNGLTYQEFTREIAERVSGMDDLAKERIVDWIEFKTRDEIIEPGGLLQRGMNDVEVRVAERFEELGVAEDVPRLQAVEKLIEGLQENKSQLREKLNQLGRRETSEALDQTISRVQRLAEDTPDTREEIMAQLNLDAQEQEAVELISQFRGSDPDDFSMFAVGRLAGAPEKPSQFASGRDWFANAKGMTDEEIEAGKMLDRLLDDAFSESGLDASRQIGGYWPHMRKMAQQGFSPEEEFVKRALPEAFDWSHAHLRTGELNIYAKDPAEVAHRYVRSLAMSKHFDPVMPDMLDEIDRIKGVDGRVGRIMEEYVAELRGQTHSSFGKIENAIRSMSRALGFDPGEGIVENTVNTLMSLTYGATIPFRPALTARNYFQPFQMIAPRTGIRDFWEGVKRAATDEGYEMARRAGAIPENVNPVHASTELDLGNVTRQLSQRLDALVRTGFDWYRSADQWGRAVAYHAQRSRIARHQDAYMKGDIDFDTFMRRVKGKTFRDVDQQRFADLIAEGNMEEAKDYLGRTLARETIMRYGHANHPAGWGSVYGRLFGQFGSWPIQYKDFLLQGLTQGTTKDIAEFAAMHTAINLSVVGAGAKVGVDMMNWLSFPSLQYTGGPFADIALNMAQLIGGSEAERDMALRNLKFQFPTLENPQSIFIPLSYSVGDLVEGARAGGGEGIAQAFGFKMMSPQQEGPFEKMRDLF